VFGKVPAWRDEAYAGMVARVTTTPSPWRMRRVDESVSTEMDSGATSPGVDEAKGDGDGVRDDRVGLSVFGDWE